MTGFMDGRLILVTFNMFILINNVGLDEIAEMKSVINSETLSIQVTYNCDNVLFSFRNTVNNNKNPDMSTFRNGRYYD